MKYLFLIVFVILFCSCDSNHSFTVEKPIINQYFEYDIVLIDSCEYILMPSKITHKGNCKNKIHCYNK